jgi:hypothetical protein
MPPDKKNLHTKRDREREKGDEVGEPALYKLKNLPTVRKEVSQPRLELKAVPVPVLRIRIHRIHIFLGFPDSHPDPLVKDPDPYRTKISWIRNTH